MKSNMDSSLEYDSVVKPILDYINSLPNAKAINIHGGIFSERGTPDIIGCINGRFIAFECKRSANEEPTKIQKWRLSEWIASKAIVGAVSSLDDAVMILQLMGVI